MEKFKNPSVDLDLKMIRERQMYPMVFLKKNRKIRKKWDPHLGVEIEGAATSGSASGLGRRVINTIGYPKSQVVRPRSG